MPRQTPSEVLDVSDAGDSLFAASPVEERAAGLSEREARRRLEQHGANELEEHKTGVLRKLLRFYWGPIPWMIETAAVLSLIVRHWADFIIICVLLAFNAAIGFWQEHKADNAIAQLKKNLALRARVRRDGRWHTVPARSLVPGDLIRLRLGDIVPADVELVDDGRLDVDQSVLTGESLPVEKATGDAAYSGSIVHQGEADALVVATGMKTYFGKTTRLVQGARERSHYQKTVLKIGHFLILVTVALVSLIVLVAIFRGASLIETARFCLILTVAAIPVALPAVLSVTMAVGAIKLARRKAIVSRLVSIEELAGMDVLCCDKTGTLTRNSLAIGTPVALSDAEAGEIMACARLASRADNDDPIDQAIFEASQQVRTTECDYHVESFKPFDPVHKRTEATVDYGNGQRGRVSKGAPQAILSLCGDGDALTRRVNGEVDALAARGHRALAVARTDESGQWKMLGLLPMFDPPREDSAATIKAARDVGIAVKMVTGDHLAIAKETARQLEMGERIRPAGALFENHHELARDDVEQADGFAQVYPEHKHRIVKALQQCGHYVGMTGDGVNDAPALKQADVGIAVSGATGAARSAADLVLTAPGLSVIIDAVKESRRIFRRMNAYAIYRIAETIRVLLFMTLSILVFDFYPVTAVMIIILAVLNDGAIMMIAYDRTNLPPGPARWDMRFVLPTASVLGVFGVISSFLMFWIAESVLQLDRQTIQTVMFLKLAVAGHMTIYLSRTGTGHFWARPAPSPLMFGILEFNQLLATLAAVFGVLMAPIGWKLAGFIWLYALAWFVVNDQVKVLTLRLLRHEVKEEKRHLDRISQPLHAHARPT